MKNAKIQWKDLTNAQLAHAIELMIRPQWLTERKTMIAILKSQEFDAEDTAHQLQENQYLNAGPYLELVS